MIRCARRHVWAPAWSVVAPVLAAARAGYVTSSVDPSPSTFKGFGGIGIDVQLCGSLQVRANLTVAHGFVDVAHCVFGALEPHGQTRVTQVGYTMPDASRQGTVLLHPHFFTDDVDLALVLRPHAQHGPWTWACVAGNDTFKSILLGARGAVRRDAARVQGLAECLIEVAGQPPALCLADTVMGRIKDVGHPGMSGYPVRQLQRDGRGGVRLGKLVGMFQARAQGRSFSARPAKIAKCLDDVGGHAYYAWKDADGLRPERWITLPLGELLRGHDPRAMAERAVMTWHTSASSLTAAPVFAPPLAAVWSMPPPATLQPPAAAAASSPLPGDAVAAILARLDAMDRKMDRGFAAVDHKIAAVDDKIDDLRRDVCHQLDVGFQLMHARFDDAASRAANFATVRDLAAALGPGSAWVDATRGGQWRVTLDQEAEHVQVNDATGKVIHERRATGHELVAGLRVHAYDTERVSKH